MLRNLDKVTKKGKEMAETVVKAVQEVGKLYIWYKILTSFVIIILCAAAAIAVEVYIRRGWKKAMRVIKDVRCHDVVVKDCSVVHGTQQCTERSKKRCSIKFTGGIDGVRHVEYATERVPASGAHVELYFDPRNVASTITLSPYPKAVVLGVLGLVALF